MNTAVTIAIVLGGALSVVVGMCTDRDGLLDRLCGFESSATGQDAENLTAREAPQGLDIAPGK